jgi:hypothetical protein
MDGSHFGYNQKFFKKTLISSSHPPLQTLKFQGGILGGPSE